MDLEWQQEIYCKRLIIERKMNLAKNKNTEYNIHKIKNLRYNYLFYNKKYISGLVIGCFIANLASPMGMWDMMFGTLATLLATLSISKQKNLFVAAFLGALFNGAIIGLELHLAFQLPLVINMIYVFIGEFIVLLVGIVVCKWMEKNQTFMNKYIL